MSGESEAAAGERGPDPFPEEWGAPAGRPSSEVRAGWIRQKVREHQALTAHRRLARRDAELVRALRLAQMGPRRDGA